MLRLRRQDRCQCLGGGVACPLADRGGLRPVLGRDRGAADEGLVIELAVQVGAVAAERLGRVHRRVGAVDEHVELELRSAPAGDADADGRLQRLVVGDHELPRHDQVAQLLGQHDGVLGQRLGQDQHELLAAVAAEGVTCPHRPREQPRHLPQDGVAGLCPKVSLIGLKRSMSMKATLNGL